jgi:hypothetical protein
MLRDCWHTRGVTNSGSGMPHLDGAPPTSPAVFPSCPTTRIAISSASIPHEPSLSIYVLVQFAAILIAHSHLLAVLPKQSSAGNRRYFLFLVLNLALLGGLLENRRIFWILKRAASSMRGLCPGYRWMVRQPAWHGQPDGRRFVCSALSIGLFYSEIVAKILEGTWSRALLIPGSEQPVASSVAPLFDVPLLPSVSAPISCASCLTSSALGSVSATTAACRKSSSKRPSFRADVAASECSGGPT